jgi:stage II sporulation protein D
MKRLCPMAVFLLLFSALFGLFPTLSDASPKLVRIGIEIGVQSGTVESGSTVRCRDASGRVFPAGSRVNVETSAGRTLVNGQPASLPLDFESSAPLLWNGRAYRGTLRLVPHVRGFSVVNVLDVESYLRGVLKIEVNPAWPIEALKAQAVIARTYALRQAGRHGSEGFDLCATTHCQAYRGMPAEDPKLDQAIAETRGIVVFYGPNLAQTYYFADGAGWTADVSTVWGGGIPYLTCRPEPVNYETPHSRWKAAVTQDALQKIMDALKMPVGTVLEIRAAKRDQGNRVTLLEVKGTAGTATVKGHSFRMAAGSNLIRSTLFEVSASASGVAVQDAPSGDSAQDVASPSKAGEDPLVTLTRQGAFSSAELMDMLLHPEKRGDYLKKALAGVASPQTKPLSPPFTPIPKPSIAGTAPAVFEFQGRGWGHGVGLSQWGAKTLSENGWRYEAILGHYFPGTTLRAIP